ncbi:MAG: hypothetical protein K8R86_13240 [Bacteroidales bacterium]|nr:hypothetical protein [Bacteroidales bacterium]
MQKMLKIVTNFTQPSDYYYWSAKTYIERLEAIEFLRQQFLKYKNVNEGLQRVYTITHIKNKKATGRYRDLDDLENLVKK